MSHIEPMTIDIPQTVLDDLRQRLERTRWPEEVPEGGWNRGVDLKYMKDLVAYWLDEYDWRAQEQALNQYQHFRANIDGLRVHFIHHKGQGPNPMPLFMICN